MVFSFISKYSNIIIIQSTNFKYEIFVDLWNGAVLIASDVIFCLTCLMHLQLVKTTVLDSNDEVELIWRQ